MSVFLGLEMDEPFDEFDVLGAYDGDGDLIAPRVRIYDPFSSDYHQQVVAPLLLDPILAYQSHFQTNPVVWDGQRYEQIGELQLPGADLKLQWENGMTHELNEAVFSGFELALEDQEISREFSALFQTFSQSSALKSNLPAGLPATSNQADPKLIFCFQHP